MRISLSCQGPHVVDLVHRIRLNLSGITSQSQILLSPVFPAGLKVSLSCSSDRPQTVHWVSHSHPLGNILFYIFSCQIK